MRHARGIPADERGSSAAAGASSAVGSGDEAPSGSSTPLATDADSATTTTPVEEQTAADAPALGEGVEAPAEDEGQSSQPMTAEAPAAVPQSTPEPELAPANDNDPADPLPATGTDG